MFEQEIFLLMSNLKSILKEHINEIIVDMNEELLNDRIIRFWKRNDEDLTFSFGIQNGEAVAKTMTIDYITMMVER